ncbi:MAG: hypothetical protein AABX61_03235 [Nanoarchaeota archaeon]
MKKENFFYLIIILTILIARLSVIIFPNKSLYINGIHIHHLWYGVILILVAVFLKNYKEVKFYCHAIGIGLITDELVFIVVLGGEINLYFNTISILGMIILLLIIYQFRKKIIKFLGLT